MAEKSFITNHSTNRFLANILELFEKDDFREKLRELAPPERSTVGAIEKFVRQTKGRLEGSADDLVSKGGLDQLSNNLQNVWNELNSFQTNDNPGHLTNAAANLDGALTTASWVFFDRPVRNTKVFGESIASVRRTSQSAIASIESGRKNADDKANDLQSRLDALSITIDQNLEKLNGISSSSDAHLNEISSEFSQIKTAIEQERQEEQEKWRRENKDFFEREEKNSKESLDLIATYEADARKILQIVGNIGLTGNFQKRSSDEHGEANFWRWVTLALFAIGTLLISVSLISNIYSNTTLELLFVRLAIGAAITLPAIYTARESARHRTNSDRAKQIELELASLTPFIDGLPDDEKWKVISILTPKYFGGERVESHEIETSDSFEKMVDLVSKLENRLPR